MLQLHNYYLSNYGITNKKGRAVPLTLEGTCRPFNPGMTKKEGCAELRSPVRRFSEEEGCGELRSPV